MQQPSLSSIAEMQRQVDSQMDSFMSPFSSMRQMEARMDEQFREFDRQFDRAFADVDKAQRQLDAELARSMRQLQQQEPGVSIERREERSPGSYRCGAAQGEL
jgi:outer membrane protein TolC